MNKKVIISSSVLIVIMIIFFMERADLKEAGILIYLLGIFEVFYLIFMIFFSLTSNPQLIWARAISAEDSLSAIHE